MRKIVAAERTAPFSLSGSPEDGELAEASARGDASAFGMLVQRHERAVAAVIYATTNVAAWTADLAQETFLAAWRSLASLKENEHFRPWICGIARNLARHALRRQRIESSAGDLVGDALISGAPDPAALTLRREEEQMLQEALRRIPETYRLPLVLFYADDERVESIAATLQISVEGVRQRLSRGRRMLRGEVDQFRDAVRKATRTRAGFAAAVVLALGLRRATPAQAAPRAIPRWPLLLAGAAAVVSVVVVGIAVKRPAPRRLPVATRATPLPPPRVALPPAPAAGLAGVVLGPDGTPVEGAEIVATGPAPQPEVAARSAAQGTFQLALPPGRYHVTASAAPHLPALALVAVTEAGGHVELRLGGGGVTLAGRITDVVAGVVPAAVVRAFARPLDDSEPRTVYQAVSDAQGRYRLTLPAGRYALAASGPGYAAQSSRVHAGVDQTIDFALAPGARLAGRVVERASGRALPGAMVSLLPESGGPPRAAVAGPDGQFVLEDLAPGSYHLWGNGGTLTGMAAAPLWLTLGDRHDGALVQLEPGATVSGRVVREGDGAPLAAAEVALADSDGALPPFATETDAEGRYRLDGVPPGRYFLDVRAAGRATARRALAVREVGALPQDAVALGPPASVVGRVLTRGGAPAAAAQVTARVRAIGRAPGRAFVTRTDDDGRFALREIDAGEITLAVEAGARGRADVRKAPLASGETKTLELTLGAGVSVAGTVRFEDGAPAPGAMITAAPPDGEIVQGRADEHGRFFLGPLPPGELLVAAWPQGGDTPLGIVDLGARRAHIRRLRAGGRAQVELQLPRAFRSLGGQIAGGDGMPVAGATVELASAADWPSQRGVAWTVSGPDGRFRFERVPLTAPAAVVTHPAYAAGPPVPLDSADVRIRLAAPATLSGTVTDEDGRPVPRFRLSADAGGLGAHHVFAADGRFTLSGLPPGSYDLIATTADDRAGVLRAVEVAAGGQRTDVRVVVRLGAALTGRVIAAAIKRPPAGALLVTRQGDLRRVHAVDPAGFFRADGLVPGQRVTVDVEPGFSAYRHSARVFELPEAGGTLDAGLIVRYRLPRSLKRDARGLLADIDPGR